MEAISKVTPVNECTAPAEPGEEWRWIPDDRIEPNMFQVSNFGRVFNVKTGRLLKLSVPKVAGYRIAVLPKAESSKPRKYVGLYVHRLVAALFLPPPLPGQTQVDHIDGDRLNNRFDNLRWATPGENMMNPITRQHARESYAARSEKQCIPVICISDNNRPFKSEKEAADYYHISPITVSNWCRRIDKPVKIARTKCNGKPIYRFRYADSTEIAEMAIGDVEITAATDTAYNSKAVVYLGGKKERWFPSIKAAARELGVTPVAISRACNLHESGANRHLRAGKIKFLFRWATPEDVPQKED